MCSRIVNILFTVRLLSGSSAGLKITSSCTERQAQAGLDIDIVCPVHTCDPGYQKMMAHADVFILWGTETAWVKEDGGVLGLNYLKCSDYQEPTGTWSQ